MTKKETFHNRNFSRLLINEPPLQVLPSLAVAIGLNEAIVVQQVHYWLSIPNFGHVDEAGLKWVHYSAQEWQKQFPFWSLDTVRRALNSLRASGVVVTKPMPNGFDRTLLYRISENKVDELGLRLIDPSAMEIWADSIGVFRRPGFSSNYHPVPRDVRTLIFERDGSRCRLCGSGDDLCVDHIVPRIMGGGNAEENLQTLCRSCNSKKGGRL